MKEQIGQLLTRARGAWRYRWYALICAWTVAILGWLFIMMIPDGYEARARVYVDTDSVLKPLLNGLAVNTDVSSRVAMMSHVIMGRPHLERVARETGLARRAATPEDLSRLVESLARDITLEGGGNFYTLRYTDTDPAMAQRVVQDLLNAFVEDTLGIKRADSGSAQQFLESQIHDYEARLRDAEDRLAEFKRANVGLMPGESGDYFTRLQAATARLQELGAKVRLATERRAELNKQLAGEEPTFGLFTSSSPSDSGGSTAIDGQIADYRRQLEQLLLQYTDKHPRVIALRDTIAQLEAQKTAAERAPKSRSAGRPAPKDPSQAAAFALDLNPVYQNLRMELSRTDVELVELHQEFEEETRVASDLKSRVNTVPVVEAQLTQLTRDYEVTKTQYQALLQRLDSARLSQQAEASNDQVKFRIIEPAARPLVSAGPNRPRLITLALAVALGSGIGLAVLLSELNPVFVSRAMLSTVTGLPVLGSISFVRPNSESALVRRDPLLVGLGGAALAVAYLMVIGLAEPMSHMARGLIQ